MTNTTQPTAPAGPVYLSDAPRSTIVTLQYPFQLDGVDYRTVEVRRITGREAQAWSRAIREFATGDGIEPQFPGILLPAAAFDALDDDDLAELDKVADGFYPARFAPLRDLARQMAAAGLNATSGEF